MLKSLQENRNDRRGNPNYIIEIFSQVIPGTDKKFFRELADRGFDLSTLKFQIDLTPERLAEVKAAQEKTNK